MSREGTREHWYLLQLTIIHCCSNFCYIFISFMLYINCWLILPPCCKTRWKMRVFDRPTIFPLTLVFLSCSPLYSLPFHFDTIAYFLECLGLSLAEYARYSLLLYFPTLLFRLIGRCSRCWSPGAEDPRCLLRPRVARWPGVVSVVPRQEASPFRSVSLMLFVLAFLRHNLTNYGCTQISCLYNLCIRILVIPDL